MDEISEKEIIEKIQHGEIDYFAFLVKKYASILYRYTLHKISHKEDAEDVVQTSFIKAYKAIDSFEPHRSFYAYLFTILKNEIVNFYRNRHAVSALQEDLIGQATEQQEVAMTIETLFQALKPEQRNVLQLYYLEGYSYQEIAEKLRKPLNTIKTIIRRAKQEAHKIYEQKN